MHPLDPIGCHTFSYILRLFTGSFVSQESSDFCSLYGWLLLTKPQVKCHFLRNAVLLTTSKSVHALDSIFQHLVLWLFSILNSLILSFVVLFSYTYCSLSRDNLCLSSCHRITSSNTEYLLINCRTCGFKKVIRTRIKVNMTNKWLKEAHYNNLPSPNCTTAPCPNLPHPTAVVIHTLSYITSYKKGTSVPPRLLSQKSK